ncbi:hypothetical protein EOD42_14335 [Rhodovarius crocodyli]|uniref:Uncharacterized protein n=1 Tax=Rhodovarius crocodyli TaxID=1979269 RepID=A0A437MF86_9PROT|nr:hypothetical protein [Rhodovarius crocodyli]RVT96285.1 hypothetical protein EOD42_14335 [Rhodovarius crocodyli]
MPTDLTAECLAGYDAPKGAACPYMFSSSSWLAWMAGRRVAGMSRPTACRSSRGYSVRIKTAGGSQVLVAFAGPDLTEITMDRAP